MGTSIQAAVEEYCALALPGRPRLKVAGVTPVAAGGETETYRVDLEHGPPGRRRREPLVLRVFPEPRGATPARHEAAALESLRGAGYPVPKVHAVAVENSPLGRPFLILEQIDGRELTGHLADATDRRRKDLLSLFSRLLVRLHGLDWSLLSGAGPGLAPGGPYAFVDRYLQRARGLLTRARLDGFGPIVDWLEERREAVPCPRPVIVHGDFHPHNVLVRADGSAVVIDWSRCHVSDPRFDLAWATLLLRTQGSVAWSEQVRAEYERQAGIRVEEFGWFEVCACATRLGSLAATEARRRAEGRARGPAVAAGQPGDGERRTYELLVERAGIRLPEVEAFLATST